MLGIALQTWLSSNAMESVVFRPMIFNNNLFVVLSTLLAFALIIGGFVCLWQVSPWIVAISIVIIFAFVLYSRKIGSDKAKVEIVFKLYQQLKIHEQFKIPPTFTNDNEMFCAIVKRYFETLMWDENKVSIILSAFSKSALRKTNIKQVAGFILSVEKPLDSIYQIGEERYYNAVAKRSKTIDAVYSKTFSEG